MRHTLLIVVLLTVVGAAAGLTWWFTRPESGTRDLVLYGNVDLRQVELPFNNSERIAAVLVQEGDRVRRGQVLSRLDTSRLEPQVAQAEARVAAQRQVVARLHNGSRPEEIAQARANVALAVAEARLTVNQKALALAIAGPRKEEVAEAEARLRADEAQLALLRQELADAQLVAPLDAVVRTRIMEPGEMASPQRPVFSLAITDPKWVRAYVSEPDLGRVRPGTAASVVVDSFPERRFDGWVGFIAPVAEFTPKTVQTEELRTSLVYEVRVFVKDPSNDLRLGMPATVHLSLDHRDPPPQTAPVAEGKR
jgi:HlyD family secretion protein